MNRISRNVSIALRAERLIAQRRVAVLRSQTGLMAAAGLVAAIGLVMLNVAAFYALSTAFTPQGAALIVALANFTLAAIFGFWAGRINADADVQGAAEVRDMAIEDLEAEVELATREVRQAVADMRQFAKNPLGATMPALVAALVSALAKSKHK